MSNPATITFGRFNPPTEEGHGKLVSAVQAHAEKTGGAHYIYPSHSQDKKKNPLSHTDKVHAMTRLFPSAHVVSDESVRTPIDAVKHAASKGHDEVTMVVGSDRVKEMHGLLNKYREKEFPTVKKVHVVSAGNRDPDAEGAEGMSASKLRGLVSSGKKDEFVSHYSDKKLGAEIHDKVKKGLQMESNVPMGIFLLGGPGSGKDYVLKNIFSKFDLVEVQIDQFLSGKVNSLIENKVNLIINGVADEERINMAKTMLEGYDFDHVYVSVSNKVSRLRNEMREQPLDEKARIGKLLKADKLSESLDGVFTFNNSINLSESSQIEQFFFASQIEKLLERLVNNGLEMIEEKKKEKSVLLKGFKHVKKDGQHVVVKENIDELFETEIKENEDGVSLRSSSGDASDSGSLEVDRSEGNTRGRKLERDSSLGESYANSRANHNSRRSFRDYRTRIDEAEAQSKEVDVSPKVKTKKAKSLMTAGKQLDATMAGIPVVSGRLATDM